MAIAGDLAREYNLPLAIHLDHHESLADIESKVMAGIRSVMIDGSHFPFEENVALVKAWSIFAIATTPAWRQNWAALVGSKMI